MTAAGGKSAREVGRDDPGDPHRSRARQRQDSLVVQGGPYGAFTSHSAQGLTAERVLIHADTAVHPDLLNSRFGYVSVSRASHEATVITDDAAKLGRQLGVEISKTSALEVSQTTPIAQGIGLA